MIRAFGVETVELELPPLVGAFGRRLHDAGVPVSAERAARFAAALTLTGPFPGGGCTGRRGRCSSQTRPGEDLRPRVRRGVRRRRARRRSLGDRGRAPGPPLPTDDRPVARSARHRPDGHQDDAWAAGTAPAPSRDRRRARPWTSSRSACSPLTRRSSAPSDLRRSTPMSWPRCIGSCPPGAGDAAAAHAPGRALPPRRDDRPAPHAAREPAHRRRPHPSGPSSPAGRAPAARPALRHLGIDGALRPRLPAVPDLRCRGGDRRTRQRRSCSPPG